jgi:hypothetical protein
MMPRALIRSYRWCKKNHSVESLHAGLNVERLSDIARNVKFPTPAWRKSCIEPRQNAGLSVSTGKVA